LLAGKYSNPPMLLQRKAEPRQSTLHILDSLLIPPQSFAITSSKFSIASELTMLNSFVGAAYGNKNGSLISLIDDAKDITIFAPNNAAMELVSGTLTSMSESDLEKLLSYHIVINPNGAPFYSTTLTNSTTLQTLQGNPLTVSSASNSLFVNSARVLTSDLLISGGVIHVIDNVLSPDSTAVSPDPSLATQAPVLETAGGGNADDDKAEAPFTSFVPDVSALIASATAAPEGATSAMASRSKTSAPGRASQTAVKGVAAGLEGVRHGLLGLVGAGAALWLLVVGDLL
jgi:transforming growth factor-beta-induced protein